MKLKKYRRWLVPLVILIVLYGALALALQAVGLENAKHFMRGTGWWAPIIFTLLCTISLIVAPLSGGSLFVVGGALFGKDVAWTLSWYASLLGCSINFWISRKFGRTMVSRLIGQGNLDQLDRFTRRFQGHQDILGMILIMPLSQDIISYAVGLTRIPYLRFFIALSISGALITAAYIYLGTSLLEAIVQR